MPRLFGQTSAAPRRIRPWGSRRRAATEASGRLAFGIVKIV